MEASLGGSFGGLGAWRGDGAPPVSSRGPRVCVRVLIPSAYKDASPPGSGPTLVTSFDLRHFLQSPVSKCSHIGRCWELGRDSMNLGSHRSAHNTPRASAADWAQRASGGRTESGRLAAEPGPDPLDTEAPDEEAPGQR